MTSVVNFQDLNVAQMSKQRHKDKRSSEVQITSQNHFLSSYDVKSWQKLAPESFRTMITKKTAIDVNCLSIPLPNPYFIFIFSNINQKKVLNITNITLTREYFIIMKYFPPNILLNF